PIAEGKAWPACARKCAPLGLIQVVNANSQDPLSKSRKTARPPAMKILQTKSAPNPRRVRIFLAEKNLQVPFEELDLMGGALKTPEFTKLNPFQRVPVLLLEDGTAIAETMAICRYFEKTNPEPALFGRTAIELAQVEMWNRRMELGLLYSVAQAFRHL